MYLFTITLQQGDFEGILKDTKHLSAYVPFPGLASEIQIINITAETGGLDLGPSSGLVVEGSGLMRSETNGRRAHTTTSLVRSEVSAAQVFTRTQINAPTSRCVCSVCWSLPSLCYHDWRGQEPVTAGHLSVG